MLSINIKCLMLSFFVFSCATSKIEKLDINNQSEKEQTWEQEENDVKKSAIQECTNCLPGVKPKTEEGIQDYYAYGTEHLNLENRQYGIPIVYNKSTKKWIDYFTGRGRGQLERYIENAKVYGPLISEILAEYQMPRDLVFLLLAESGFQIHARSRARAMGLWQFMKFTGIRFGLTVDWYLDQRKDPFKSTIAAIKYLSLLKDRFKAWELAWASYNAGEAKVGRAIKRYRTKNFWKLRKGRYLRSETKNYVPKIMALAIIGKNLQQFGFEEIKLTSPLQYEIVKVPELTDLYKVAQSLNLSYDDLRDLNPELRRWQTPPETDYGLKVPMGSKELWNTCCANILAEFKSDSYQEYKSPKWFKLSHIAKRHKVPVKILSQINNVNKNITVKKGETILLPFRKGQSRKHIMYRDLWDRRRKRRRGISFSKHIRLAKLHGKKVSNPTEFYTVKKGDTLWDVSKITGVSLNTIIKSNLTKVKNGAIYPGDKLIIK